MGEVLRFTESISQKVESGMKEVQEVVHDIVNPRRACAARVTVLGLSFRPSVVPSVCLLPRFLPLRVTRRPKSDTNGFSATLALF